jgi:hypothetical protein
VFFITITFRPPSDVGRNRTSRSVTVMPTPDFARRLFMKFVAHLEHELGSHVAFAVADQLGKGGGRFHQHALVAGAGLRTYPRREIEMWLRRRAGFSRVLPFRKGAAFYLARYIGRDAENADWDLRIKPEEEPRPRPNQAGRVVTVRSAEMPQAFFQRGLRSYQRGKKEEKQ